MMSIHESTLPSGNSGTADKDTGAEGDADADVETLEPRPIDIDALGELAALQGVVKFPVRIKCATLSWNTLAQGLDESENEPAA
jgi:nitrogen fixation protein NifU and related proteins